MAKRRQQGGKGLNTVLFYLAIVSGPILLSIVGAYIYNTYSEAQATINPEAVFASKINAKKVNQFAKFDDSGDFVIQSITYSNFTTHSPFPEEKPLHISALPVKQWAVANVDLINVSQSNRSVLVNARWQRNAVFLDLNEADDHGMIGSSEGTYISDIPLSSFLNAVFHPNKYIFWADQLPAFMSLTRVTSDAKLDSFQQTFNLTMTPIITLAHPGVIFQTRYSEYNQYVVQLQGTSQLLLFAPSQSMQPYPSFHYSFHHSQILLTAPSSNVSMKVINITLSRGEAVYIPAYYYYNLQASDLSLHLAMPSKSSATIALRQLYRMQVPFGAFESSPELRQAAVITFVRHLFLSKGISYEAFVAELYSSRYMKMFPPKWISFHKKHFQCPNLQDSRTLQLLEQENSNFITAASTVMNHLDSVAVHSAIKMTVLGDYVEQLCRWAVGAESVVFMLYECFG